MIKEFIIDDYVIVKNKKFMLNLNVYRNTHYHVLNKAKQQFMSNLIAANVEILNYKFLAVKITYTIIPHNKALFDTQNIISIVDKFFCDTLVAFRIIPDDNYNYVTYGAHSVAEITKNKCKKIVIKCEFF
jgi:hypothetical protein